MKDTEKNVCQEIIKIIKEISGSEIEDKKLLTAEYMDSGLINSLQVVEMIVTMEDVFKIKFSPDDLRSAQFRTVKGLVGLVCALMQIKS